MAVACLQENSERANCRRYMTSVCGAIWYPHPNTGIGECVGVRDDERLGRVFEFNPIARVTLVAY